MIKFSSSEQAINVIMFLQFLGLPSNCFKMQWLNGVVETAKNEHDDFAEGVRMDVVFATICASFVWLTQLSTIQIQPIQILLELHIFYNRVTIDEGCVFDLWRCSRSIRIVCACAGGGHEGRPLFAFFCKGRQSSSQLSECLCNSSDLG